MDAETRAAFDGLRGGVDDLRHQVGDLRQDVGDLRQHVGDLRQHVDERFDRVDQRVDATRREFHVVAESLRGDMRLLAEGFTLRIDRLEATLRDEMVRSHNELGTLLRLGYADLDRRVTALERRPRDAT